MKKLIMMVCALSMCLSLTSCVSDPEGEPTQAELLEQQDYYVPWWIKDENEKKLW